MIESFGAGSRPNCSSGNTREPIVLDHCALGSVGPPMQEDAPSTHSSWGSIRPLDIAMPDP
jgi:hypothetical protein